MLAWRGCPVASKRPDLRGCYGVSPNSGKPVGSRHRWRGKWGVGSCLYCQRDLGQLLIKPHESAADLPLAVVIERTQRPEKPAHCVYPHCRCKEPRWCYDGPPKGTGGVKEVPRG